MSSVRENGCMNSARESAVLLLSGVVLLLTAGIQADEGEWQLVRKTRTGDLYHRETGDSSVPWTMIAARFAAAPARIHAIVMDYNHFSEFIPNVSESRIIRDTGSEQWVYQHLSFPGPVADRRYVFVSTDRDSRPEDGYYRVEWVLSDKSFPALICPQPSGRWPLQDSGKFNPAGMPVRPRRVMLYTVIPVDCFRGGWCQP
jgi:hypothetical protein